jgi:hypothetical protein
MKTQVTAKRRGAPQRCFGNQEERQSYRKPNEAHILAPITAEPSYDWTRGMFPLSNGLQVAFVSYHLIAHRLK